MPAIVIGTGCRKNEISQIRPGWTLTKGTVIMDKQPLDDARISFVPKGLSPPSNQEKWHSAAILKGKFQIEIPPGDYNVRIQKYKEEARFVLVPTISMKYDHDTTLSATIELDEPNELLFELESDPATQSD